MQKKYYVVREGRKSGIYATWAECKAQVDGFSGAVYKSFLTMAEAEAYLRPSGTDNGEGLADSEIAIAYVDGSFDKRVRKYAYGCVILYQGERVELSGAGDDAKYIGMHNVAGEILGSVYAIRWAINHGVKKIQVHHDYEGIAKWATGDWKANKEGTQEYQQFVKESREKIYIGFTKVAAHTGVELNERADQLAKAALGL